MKAKEEEEFKQPMGVVKRMKVSEDKALIKTPFPQDADADF